MKKLILSSATVLLLMYSVAFIQVGCQKVEASPAVQSQLASSQNVILLYIGSNLVTMDYDGNNQKPVDLQLPASESITKTSFRLNADGTKIFFATTKNLYSCDLDGLNLKVILPIATSVVVLDVK